MDYLFYVRIVNRLVSYSDIDSISLNSKISFIFLNLSIWKNIVDKKFIINFLYFAFTPFKSEKEKCPKVVGPLFLAHYLLLDLI